MQNVQLTIARIHGAHDNQIVRIDVTDGAKLVSRTEVDLSTFAACLMGLGKVEAMHTTIREVRTR